MNDIGKKWVVKIKEKQDGTLERYKERLVGNRDTINKRD